VRQNLLRHPEIVDACVSDYIPFVLPVVMILVGGRKSWGQGIREDQQCSYDFCAYLQSGNAQRRFFIWISGWSRKMPDQRTAARLFGWKKARVTSETYNIDTRSLVWSRIMSCFPCITRWNLIFICYCLIRSIRTEFYSFRFVPGSEKSAMKIIKDEFEAAFRWCIWIFKK